MNKIFSFIITLFLTLHVFAGEGMWIPSLLSQLNEGDMQSKGLKLSAEQIYSINNSSIKDAIVHFGGGCTSELISSDGLLLTNHHCGYGSIQSHSSVENDYLSKGFWAMNSGEELPNKGLTASIVKRIEDVTSQALEGVLDTMSEKLRQETIKKNNEKIIANATENTHYKAVIKPFYYGNEYYMIVTEVFEDVRLVGAPPSSIGKYGFDTDNWIWPRHTGDFSLFRIYANKDNQPASYSKDNVPYKPSHFLPINLEGVKEGDFTMVYGYPGKTQEYLTSYAVKQIQDVSYPIKIAIRTKKLEIMDANMAGSAEVRIKYAAKQSRTSNAWKKWQGERRGLKKYDAVGKKEELERRFTEKAQMNSDGYGQYIDLMASFKKEYEALEPLQIGRDYFIEAGYLGSDVFSFVAGYRTAVESYQKGETPDSSVLAKLQRGVKGFFKNYDKATDRAIFVGMLEMYSKAPNNEYTPNVIHKEIKGNVIKYTTKVYDGSIFIDQKALQELVDDPSEKNFKKLSSDPLYNLVNELFNHYTDKIKPDYDAISDKIDELTRSYMKGLMKVLPDEKMYYPDANSTLRIAYGKIEPYEPRDGLIYKYYTTLDGVIEKYDPTTKEFDLPKRLIELHAKKDYGKYGKDGELRVCFIASNHTTGGNSGSPVLNGTGELIGLNFDRNWEGTMSDIMYDPSQCRNISVDLNYVLFIIDKFAGAGYLLENMKIKYPE